MNNEKLTIGIPRALLYYRYADLWENFFHELGFKVVYSPETNNEILERGKQLSIDEACLPFKIYLGHVDYLIDKVDYLLVPRIVSLKKGEKLCVNFCALYDVVNNLFDTRILNYNVHIEKGETEKKAFLKIGKELGKNNKLIIKAYRKAKRIAAKNAEYHYIKQYNTIASSKKIKILLVARSYNVNDKLIGEPIVKYLKSLDVEIIYADIFNEKEIQDKYKMISKQLYWTYSRELLSSMVHYLDKVDGIILLTAFPCGPDSLTNEMCMRKINLPIVNIIVDELTGEAGLHTRIESLVDIIRERKREEILHGQKNN